MGKGAGVGAPVPYHRPYHLVLTLGSEYIVQGWRRVIYCPGSLWQPPKAGQGLLAHPLLPLSAVDLPMRGRYQQGACPAQAASPSFPTPMVLVPSFPLFTNYLWTVVLVFVQCFILRHQSPAATSARRSSPCPPPCSDHIPLPKVFLRGKGHWGAAGWVTYYPSPREGGVLPLGCCSRVRRGVC